MKAATTILEISKILKISASTVSRAMKNHPDVAPATRQKVVDLAAQLDYEPNLNAVGLRTLHSKELAIIVPNLSGFFYDAFISVVEQEVRKIGYSLLVLVSGDDPDVELQHLKICKQRRVEGLMVCLTLHTTSIDAFIKLQKLEIPVIFFDKILDTPNQNTVRVADEKAAVLAGEALLHKNKKRILSLFANPQLSITYRRLEAYKEVFEAKENSHLIEVVFTTSSSDAEETVRKALRSSEKPDAIFCMSDEILIGAMKAIQQCGIKYPEDLGIIAISNGFFPTLYFPEITYVETSAKQLGHLAFSRLMTIINGDKTPQDITVNAVLVERGSL